MAKTYTLQGTVNAGFSTRWTDDDWREYTTANSLSGDDNKRRIIGKYNSNYRAVNITFDSAQLAALQGKTVTSVSLTVKLLTNEVAANSNLYKIGFKKNATASSSSTSANAYARESASTTNGYVHKASSKMTAGNTYTITSADGLSQSVPSYGYAIGVSQSANAYIILDTTATLTVVTNETDYSITLSYNANGGSGGPSAETKTGTASGTPSVAFTVSNTTPTKSSTTTYTVTYNANGGSVSPASKTATKTTTYTFSKWNTNSGGSGNNYVGGNTITLSSSATLYAQYTSPTSTTTSVTLPTPTRIGYTFNGWYTAASGGTKIGNAGASYTPTATITLYAHWTIITYTITYNKGTYGTGTNTTETKTYGVELKLKDAIFTRTGYTQKGWSTAQAGDSKAYDLKAPYTANSAKTLYPYWEANTYAVTYNANGGSGAPSAQTKTYGVTLPLSSTKPTRSGYNFIQWNTKADGTGTNYASGGNYTANAAATLYAVWAAAVSTVSTTNGTLGTAQTITINRNSSSYTHNLSYTYGSQTGPIATGVGTSFSWTPLPSMASAFPSSTSGTCTITCVTMSGSTTIGTTTTTCTLSIPPSIMPSGVALTASHYSANSTVSEWATFTKGYSQANLSVTYTLNGGATLASITFSGPGMSSTGTSTTARTSVLTTSGTNTWTVTVKDSRGRTASATASKTVYDYATPVISSIGTYRCDSDGTINNGSGTYMKFLPKFSASSVNSNNSVQSAKLKWRVSGGAWSSQINVTNNTYTAVLGSGNIDIAKTYEVSVTVTDKLNSTTATATLPSASGLWCGRGNDRLGLGGVPPSAGLHCDWDATFNGVLDVTQRRCYATLSSAGWYRVLKYLYGRGGTSFSVDFDITRAFNNTNNEVHSVKMLTTYYNTAPSFVNEASKTNALNVGAIRYTIDSDGVGYVDIRYDANSANTVTVDFTAHINPSLQSGFTAVSLQSVSPSPSGETVMTEYTFAENTEYTRAAWTPTFGGTANPSVNTANCFYSVKNGVLYAGGRFNLASFTSGATTVDFTLPVSLGSADRSAEAIGTMFTTTKTLQLRWAGSTVYITDAGGNYSGGLLNTGYWSFQIVAPIYN